MTQKWANSTAILPFCLCAVLIKQQIMPPAADTATNRAQSNAPAPIRARCAGWPRQCTARFRRTPPPKTAAQTPARAFPATGGTRFCGRYWWAVRHCAARHESSLHPAAHCPAMPIRPVVRQGAGCLARAAPPTAKTTQNPAARQTKRHATTRHGRAANAIRPVLPAAASPPKGAGCLRWAHPSRIAARTCAKAAVAAPG